MVRKDVEGGKVWVAKGDHPGLFVRSLMCDGFNWISGFPPEGLEGGMKVLVKIRHKSPSIPASIMYVPSPSFSIIFLTKSTIVHTTARLWR